MVERVLKILFIPSNLCQYGCVGTPNADAWTRLRPAHLPQPRRKKMVALPGAVPTHGNRLAIGQQVLELTGS